MNTRSGLSRSRLPMALILVPSLVSVYFAYRWWSQAGEKRASQLRVWLGDPDPNTGKSIRAGDRCEQAPFIMPTDGLIGFLWEDSFRPGHTHQGIDIFGGKPAGEVPVIAAHSGYLTRLPDWKSSLIIRIPDDPQHPGRQIWTYYTHMADVDGNSFISPAFPAGTQEVFVETGTFLGYQGNFSGDPGNPTGVHLHFSIVQDDGQGDFKNELYIRNTYDPSPYFGLPLNARLNRDTVPVCTAG